MRFTSIGNKKDLNTNVSFVFTCYNADKTSVVRHKNNHDKHRITTLSLLYPRLSVAPGRYGTDFFIFKRYPFIEKHIGFTAKRRAKQCAQPFDSARFLSKGDR